MQRNVSQPRSDWEHIVESQGLLWHSVGNNGEPYWTENACYTFSSNQIDEIEKASYELNQMCLEAVEYIIGKNEGEIWDAFEIYDWMRPIIRKAWNDEEYTVFGRLDFSYDGRNPPKLLEYNADTPTGLIEQAVIQWHWLQDMVRQGSITNEKTDQFNSSHERLIEIWQVIRNHVGQNKVLHFTSLDQEAALEDYVTCNYLRDVAMQAGWTTNYIGIDKLGYNADMKRFVDENDQPIEYLCKLYPYEWLMEEEWAAYYKNCPSEYRPRLWEPPWKALLSNKAILVLLYEMFPKSPYLLKASYDQSDIGRTYVKKPQFSREGANIRIVERGTTIAETGGEYGDTDLWIYQEFYPLPNFDGARPVLGSWLCNGYATGIGIRESNELVTGNFSRFVPHYFHNNQPGFLGRVFG